MLVVGCAWSQCNVRFDPVLGQLTCPPTGAAAVCPTCATGSSLTNGQLLAGAGSQAIAITNLTGDVTTSGTVATTIANLAVTTAKINTAAVTSAKQSVEPTRRTVCIVFGANNAVSVLADSDLGPQSRQYFLPWAGTLVETEVAADGGTPNIILGRSRAGVIANVVSGALATASLGGIACSNTGGTTGLDGATTCSNTLQNTGWNVGDWITAVSGTAGGVAKEMTACLTFITTL